MTTRQRQIITGEVPELVEELVGEAMRELREQMAALEKLTNEAIAGLPPAVRAKHEAPARKGNPNPRWLNARFASVCQHASCSDRVEKGAHVWYVPGTGVYHESCAPATANAAKVAA